LKEMTLTDAVI